MKERLRSKLIKRLNPNNEKTGAEAYGETLYLRPFASDDEAINQLVRFTGERRSSIAQKLIRAGITASSIELAAEKRTPARIEWLIQDAKMKHARDDAADARTERIEDAIRESKLLNSEVMERLRRLELLTSETFCLAGVAVSYLGQIFSMMPPPLAQMEQESSIAERKRTAADRNALALVEYALSELERATEYHANSDDLPAGDSLYFATKVEKLRARISSLGAKGKPE